MGRYRLGCDIGGTFTDFVAFDEAAGAIRTAKVLTTPGDPSEAVETGLRSLGETLGEYLGETEYLIHGTTLVINAIIERKGARTGLLTTEGFRDVLEMRREIRYDIYDVGAMYPEPLIPRPLRREVAERVRADGTVLRPLDPEAVARELAALVASGVESVAVCLLHAYANPAHEEAVAAVAAERFPGLSVTLSSDVLPEMREFERTSTTAANAYVRPLVSRYVERLEGRLAACGFEGPLFLMLSGGGVIAPETARAYPVRLVESGPVGGVLAGAFLARQAGFDDLVVFDMGGTTAKASMVLGGEPLVTSEYEVDRVHRFKKGSGTPLGVPTVDIIEIGAGGGSIAEIDDLGLLKIGPESAGAAPGPICYRRGGTRPTVTDADLVLGYLDAERFLDGAMRLDAESARDGLARAVGGPLGYGPLEAAFAVHEVVNENMAAAIRMYMAEKGGDLSRTVLVASGGAGPVHAARFARKLGVPRILVPRAAGVFSALGFLVAPVSFEVARTAVRDLETVADGELATIFGEIEREAAAVVGRAVPSADIAFQRAADVRYAGQGHAVRVPLGEAVAAADVKARFLAEYARLYGHAYDDVRVQLVTPRVTATAGGRGLSGILPFEGVPGDPEQALRTVRDAFDPAEGAMVPHRVYEMARLAGGMRIEGPAVVEDAFSTFVLPAGACATADGRGWLVVDLEGDA